jgi:hypothetical protein
MNTLHTLSQHAADSPPYAFDEFERRGARRMAQRRWARHGLVASFATVGVAVAAVMTTLMSPSAPVPAESAWEPALVDVGRLAVRDSLADRIALLDLQLTEGRLYALPEEELTQLASAREQLAQSLRSVVYAHALMTY